MKTLVKFCRVQSHLAEVEVNVPDDVKDINKYLNEFVCLEETDWKYNHEDVYVEEYEVKS